MVYLGGNLCCLGDDSFDDLFINASYVVGTFLELIFRLFDSAVRLSISISLKHGIKFILYDTTIKLKYCL